jgi:phosphoserine phosphatase
MTKAVFFDFDSTISSPHRIDRLGGDWAVADRLHIFEQMTPNEIVQNFGGSQRLDVLRRLFADLVRFGVKIFVVSMCPAVGLTNHAPPRG